MASRLQIARLEQRIEALVANSGPPQLAVIEPDETVEHALERLGPGASRSSIIFICTGVPRGASTWGQW
jgi:hypothetical protein